MWLSPAVILTIGALMTFVSMWVSPETKDLELSEVGEEPMVAKAALTEISIGSQGLK